MRFVDCRRWSWRSLRASSVSVESCATVSGRALGKAALVTSVEPGAGVGGGCEAPCGKMIDSGRRR